MTRTIRRSMIACAAAALSVVALMPASMLAQAPSCVATPALPFNGQADACQKAIDLFAFILPQVGVAVSGGNPIPGDAGTLGGFGKRSLAVRVVAVDARLPENSVPLTVGAATASDFGATRAVLPLPSVDLALGLLPGIPYGLTNVGGVDLLLGATWLPSVSQDEFSLDPKNGGFGFAYGLRVGALQESSLVPGVSISWQRRHMPTTDFSYTPFNDTLRVGETTMRSDAFRLIASKRIRMFGFALGVGQDQIFGESAMTAVVNDDSGILPVRQTLSLTGLRESSKRNTAFLNASLNLIRIRLVGELGWSSEGDRRQTLNTFGGRRANEGYRYGSLGITTRF
ncbi:MAG: hypothetical protein V4617_18795 [Gemmatimonadota bacterium]